MPAKLERYKARQYYAEAVAMDFDARDFNTEIGDARQSLAKFEQKLDIKNQLLDERVDDFERARRVSQDLRSLRAEASGQQAILDELQREADLRAGAASGWTLHWERLTTL